MELKQTVMCIVSSSLAIFQFLSILPTNVFIAFIHLSVTPLFTFQPLIHPCRVTAWVCYILDSFHVCVCRSC